MPVKSDDIAARGKPIKFYSLESAKEWRAEYGGWIFAADNDIAVWFPLNCGFEPSDILIHPATHGMSGKLI
jgi:hypothetical protein